MVETLAGRDWRKIAILTVPLIVLSGSASGWLSNSGYGNDWFDSLVKPSFMPPGWAFGVAWTILYALMGMAVAMIIAQPPSRLRTYALILFVAQLALNYSWSPVFFAGHDIRLGAMIIAAMLLLALATAALFRRMWPIAGWLMLPYLLWLCFAWALNTTIDALNPGRGTSLFG